ncbi:MAG: hypothetical protein H0W81_03250 [Chloroflexi bacterium]|nr:hypothetical protein [Chloroflexota bacterium]
MKHLISALSVAVLLVGAQVGTASAAAPHVVAMINGGGTATMAEVFGISSPGTSVFALNVKLYEDHSATGHFDCVDQNGDATGFPGNIFGEVVSWSGDLNGEVTLNVVGKFLSIPGGHPVAVTFRVKIQVFGGAGVGHWTLEVPDGAGGFVVVCIETLDSGQIVRRWV